MKQLKYSSSNKKEPEAMPKPKKVSSTNPLTLIPLSKALEKYPQFFDDIKVSVVQKQILAIDMLPSKYSNIETLYLSNNSISSLDGVQQFRNLVNLSLANNDINDMSFLKYLKQIQTLQSLNLKGNPVCQFPTYRQLIIYNLPSIKILDDKVVTEEERIQAQIKLKNQEGLLQLMLKNYCDLIQLNSFSKKLEIHKSLMMNNSKYVRNSLNLVVSVQKLKRLFRYEENLDAETLEQLKDNLMRDVFTLYQELQEMTCNQAISNEDNLERAFSELIMRQKQKLAELEVKIEKKIENMEHLKQDIKIKFQMDSQLNTTAKFAQQSHRQQQQLSPKPQQQLSPKQQQQSPRQPVSSVKKSKSQQQLLSRRDQAQQPVSLQENEKDLFSRLQEDQSQQSLLSEQFKNLSPIRSNFQLPRAQGRPGNHFKSSSNNRSLSPNREIPQPSPQFERVPTQPQQKSHKDECCRQYMNLSRSLHEEQKSRSPIRKTQAHYEKLIDEMGQKLYQAEEQLRILNIINQKYKDKLLEFHSQNQQNVQIAQQEIQKINQEKRDNEDMRNLMESEVKTLRQQLNDMLLKNYNLEKVQEKYINLEQKAEQYATALDRYTQNEMKMDMAEQFNLKRQYKYFFTNLSYAVKTSKMIDFFREHKERQMTAQIITALIPRWRGLARRNKQINRIEAQNNYQSMFCHFKLWRQNIQFQKHVRIIIKDRSEKQCFDAFCNWKQFVSLEQKKQQKYAIISKYCEKKIAAKGFRGFQLLFKRMKHSFVEAKEAAKKLEKYTKSKYKIKGLRAWTQWFVDIRVPQMQIEQICFQNYKRSLLRAGFNFLFYNRLANAQTRDRVDKLIQRKSARLLKKLFRFWKEDFPNYFNQEQIQMKKIIYLYKKRTLSRWKSSIKALQQNRADLASARAIHDQGVLKRCFGALAKNRRYHKQLKLFNQVLATKKQASRLRTAYNNWYIQYLINRTDRLEKQQEDLHLEQVFFKNWQSFYRVSKLKRYKKNAAEMFLRKHIKHLLAEILLGWKYYTVRRNRNRQVVEARSLKKSYQLFRVFVIELQRQQKLKLKGHITKIVNKNSLIEADYKNNLEQMQSIDEEKLEFKQKIIELQAQLQMEHEELLQEKSNTGQLKKQLMQSEKEVQKLEEDKIALQSKIIGLQSEQDEENHDHKNELLQQSKKQGLLEIENADLQSAIAKLQKELEFTKQALCETEQNMLQKGQQTNNLLVDSDTKLQNSIMMANEFKNRILIQDQELEQLRQQLESERTRQADHKIQLNEFNTLLREQEDMYESKLLNQEKLIESNQNELMELNQQNQLLQQILSDMKVDLKKYQMEVEMLQDSKHQSNEEFIQKVKVELPYDNLDSKLNENPYVESKKHYDEFLEHDKGFLSQKNLINQRLQLLQQNLNSILGSSSQSAKRKASPYRKLLVEGQAEAQYQPKAKEFLFNQDRFRSPDIQSKRFDAISTSFMEDNSKLKPYKSMVKSEVQSPKLNRRELPARAQNSVIQQLDNQTSYAQDTNDKLNYTISGDKVSQELERNKQQIKQERENLQQRIKRLNQNMDADIMKAKNSQL